MLASLSIRDVVLIDRLDLEFRPGLCVLTGETGAGKSILLDSLGLVLGGRGDSSLVRRGADKAVIIAEFDLSPDHPARKILKDQDLADEKDAGEAVILRRQVAADGRSRGYVNDRPISIALMREIGGALAEIQGQFDQHGLLDPVTHGPLLDSHADLVPRLERTEKACKAWRAAEKTLAKEREALEKSRADEDFLRHAVQELEMFGPKAGEEDELNDLRQTMMHAEKLVEGLNGAFAALNEGQAPGGVEDRLNLALSRLEKVADMAGERLSPVLQALETALAESRDAVARLEGVSADLEMDPARQEQVEERLFALRDLARKHHCEPDQLPDLLMTLQGRLEAIDGSDSHMKALEEAARKARADYLEAAEALSKARIAAAERLDAAVNAELPPLKLEKARFSTLVERREENRWGADGLDEISFQVATNPGAAPGPIGRIASGGELSRLMLALKLVLVADSSIPTLVFDEVDSGIGGATAAAVGERLARLSEQVQVLVVTHSPQVAGRGTRHLLVAKSEADGRVSTSVTVLENAHRRQEEIARMISGAEVTDEARAAAAKLLQDSSLAAKAKPQGDLFGAGKDG